MGKPTGLAKEQRRALDRLKGVRGIERFYLAGGSAIASHLHHRRSADLDLFSLSKDVDLFTLAASLREKEPEFEVVKDPVYPPGLTPRGWERIKRHFETEAPKLLPSR